MKRSLALLLSAAVATACVHDPALNVPANGVPPHVVVDVQERDVVVTDHTGTAVTTDKDGNVISRTETTSTRVVGRERYVAGFDYLRGNERLDEEDFYRLVGDDAAVAQIDAERARGITYAHVGLAVLAVGLGGVALTAATTGDAQHAGETILSLALPIGVLLALYGAAKVRTRQLPIERALAAVGQPMPELGPVESPR